MKIQSIMSMLKRMEGTTARVTLSNKQVEEIAEKIGHKRLSEVISGMAQRHPNLKIDVAAKSSQQGFTIGAVKFREGKQVLGTGALSVTGLGTEQAVVKSRMNAGSVFYSNCYMDFAYNPKLQDLEVTTSVKNGTLYCKSRNGNFFGGHVKLDLQKLPDTKKTQVFEWANTCFANGAQTIRDFLAGKFPKLEKIAIAKKPTNIELGNFKNTSSSDKLAILDKKTTEIMHRIEQVKNPKNPTLDQIKSVTTSYNKAIEEAKKLGVDISDII